MRRTRTYGITVALMVVLVACLAAVLLTGTVDDSTASAIDNISETAAAAFAAVACWTRARRVPQVRRSWRLLAAATGAWAAGQAYWSWVEITAPGTTPFPSWADVGYLVALPLAILGLSTFRRADVDRRSWLRSTLDGVLVATSLLCLSWVVVLGPAYQADADSSLAKVLSLVYPTADVVIVTCALVALGRAHEARTRARMGLLTAGYIAVALADAAFAWMSQHDGVGGGHLVNLGWVVGFALIGLAALLPGRGSLPPDAPLGSSRSGIVVSYIPVVVWLATVATVQVVDGSIDGFVFWCSVAVVLTLMLRQGIALAENVALTRDLESRVAERAAQIESREAYFAALVRHSTDVLAVVPGLRARTSYISPSAEQILGWSIAGGVDVLEHVHPDDASRWDLALVKLEVGDEPTTTFECRVRHGAADGWRDAEVSLTDLREDPHVTGLVINLRDITVRRALEAELRDQGLRDTLTNLANRVLLRDRLLHALARQEPEQVGVIILDLDDFARVNDEIGAEGGDRVLTEIGTRLRAAARRSDTVARHSADEFVVLVDGDIDADRLDGLAATMRAACREPITVGDTTIVVHASAGVAQGRTGANADGLLTEASTALTTAKRDGKDQVRTFAPEMRRAQEHRLTLEGELRRAVERDELLLHYQPLFAAGTKTIVGAEALVRWQHPERGMVPPGSFIPLAEQCGLIVPIGNWVLERACRDAVAWPAPVGVSVNLSSRQLERDDLVPIVRGVLDDTGLAPSRLTLEVTESLLLEDIERTITALDELRALGAHVAIDDFGTGFSSLSYLERLPADSLKIDRSFVVGLGSGNDRGVVTTIIDLAAKLGMKTVAEGVEEEEQYQILRFLGTDVIQGFLFARPMPNGELVELLGTRATEDLVRHV